MITIKIKLKEGRYVTLCDSSISPITRILNWLDFNKVNYILLALFLGSFGIHKFYAGKNMQGILHLIFCWTGIPHILAIISAVITVFKPADEQGNVTL